MDGWVNHSIHGKPFQDRNTGRELGLCRKDHEFGLQHFELEMPLSLVSGHGEKSGPGVQI